MIPMRYTEGQIRTQFLSSMGMSKRLVRKFAEGVSKVGLTGRNFHVLRVS